MRGFVASCMDFTPILEEIKPTKKEEKELATAVQHVLRKIKVAGARPILGGSGAKQTWLRHTHDIDIYVTFPSKTYAHRSAELSDLLHKALRKSFSKVTRLHGSRDYFQLTYQDFVFEIVPILAIKKASDARNTTDFSQLHVNYVLKHVKKNKRLSDEIRLVKQFAKANHVYGAESYIKGFSGYVLELLTIHYGSFERLMKGAASWKATMVIGDKKVAKNLNPSKISPLIVIDPVQPDRNAAAALSEEKYYNFILACRAFLRKQSPLFFEEKHIDPCQLQKHGTLVRVDVIPLEGNRDMVGAKLLKAFTHIKEQIKHHDFTLITAKWSYNPVLKKAVFYYVADKKELSPTMKHYGPSSEHEKALLNFKKTHKNVKMMGKQSYVLKKRAYQDISLLMKDLLRSENVTSRVKKTQLSL
jgi:tRNA nucleotidyltransferase (CCA-adding enzyme)